MALIHQKNTYTIPRGRVYFNPLNRATDEYLGEIYLGNCPGLTLSIESERVTHYSSERGIREKDFSQTIETNRTGKLTCDNIAAQILALFLSGSYGTVTQSAGTVTGEKHTVLPGRYYQLGTTATAPTGARKVSAVIVTSDDAIDPTPYEAGKDYVLDAARGTLQILDTGDITAGDTVVVGYTVTATSWEGIRTGQHNDLEGSLRIAADNAAGINFDYFMPRVSLTPSGELPLITSSNDFIEIESDIDVLTPQDGRAAIYVDGQPAVA